MSSKLRRFLWALLVWESVLILAEAALFVRAGGGLRIHREDIEVFGPPLVFGVVVAALCASVAGRFGGVVSIVLGASFGVVCVVGGGVLWASQGRGFELGAGIITASLMLSIPGGVAGGIVGFLNRRRPARLNVPP